MRILICRHGDPDYEHDSLTERGILEAELLSRKLAKMNPTSIYCSTLGRAKLTAKPTVEKTGIEPVIFEWLQEYPISAKKDPGKSWMCPWEIPHHDWIDDKDAVDCENWLKFFRIEGCGFEYQKKVNENFDKLMAERGLIRKDNYYIKTPEYENHKDDLILFFCHYGLGLALLSHALPISPVLLWNGFSLDSSSVTELMVDKAGPYEGEDTAILRCMRVGDISHLYQSGIPFGQAPREWWYNEQK